jgi:hypothetical protein
MYCVVSVHFVHLCTFLAGLGSDTTAGTCCSLVQYPVGGLVGGLVGALGLGSRFR